MLLVSLVTGTFLKKKKKKKKQISENPAVFFVWSMKVKSEICITKRFSQFYFNTADMF